MKKRWIAIALLAVLLMGVGGAIGKVGIRQESGGSNLPVSAADEKYCISVAAPVISEGDVMGCVLFITPKNSPPGTELEFKLAQTVSAFLGKQMES